MKEDKTGASKLKQSYGAFKTDHPKAFKGIKYTLITGVVLFALGVLLLLGFFLAILNGYYGELPTKSELKAIQNPVASEIYSEDGVLLGRYYLENRTDVSYNQIPKDIKNALIATEDARFFKHGGIDRRAMFRVLMKTVLLQDQSAGGGSTISQQLAKNLYKRERRGKLTIPVAKLKEMIVAKRIEDIYDKEEVLTLYLNTVSFGEDVFGIKMAARRFFDTSLEDLQTDQAATLVGMLKAPTSYSPRANPTRSRLRRNTVLDQMNKYKYISSTRSDSLRKMPLRTKYNFVSHSDGPAPYFRASLKNELKKWAKTHKKRDGSPYNLYTDGLKIYTSINSKMQQYAEEAVETHMAKLQDDFWKHWRNQDPFYGDMNRINALKKQSNRYLVAKDNKWSNSKIDADFKKKRKMEVFTLKGKKTVMMSPLDSIAYYLKFLQVGFMAMEPKNGYIRAYVGGIDHKHFKYDHVKSTRQVGSTFKPIVYATALDSAYSPCTFKANKLYRYPDYQDWEPANSDDKYGGQYSMRGALMTSNNSVTAQWIMDTEPYTVVDMARRMGITEADIPEAPAIALGAADISLYEMMQAYCTMANDGRHIPPAYLLKIEDRNGKIIEKFKTNIYKRTKAMDPEDALIMLKMMESVVDSGSARRLRWKYALPNDIAGKTGTTQNQTDGWFMGITPKLVAGVWVGGDDRRVRFRTITLGQGANMALPVWGEFFQRVNKDPKFKAITEAKFEELPPHITELLDCPGYVPYDYRPPVVVTIDTAVAVIPPRPKTVKPLFDKVTKGKQDKDKVRRPKLPASPKAKRRGGKKEKEKKGLFKRLFGKKDKN